MEAELHFRLWRAIEAYVVACGGDPKRNLSGRQSARADVELVLAKVEKPSGKVCPFLLTGLRLELTHGPAQPPHTCPYRTEIDHDSKTLCTCCEACIAECNRDT